VIAEHPVNSESVVVADLDLKQLAEHRKTGAISTFADRRRRADRYRAWPSHINSTERTAR
jgi:hypothetical protein